MASERRPPRSHADYTVSCICPNVVELAPLEAMLDEIHESLPTSHDQNVYTLGSIGGHHIVVAVMSQTGSSATATVATQLLNDFPAVRFGLLVGVGGAVLGDVSDSDVQLGDVVVSQPMDILSGVVQYGLSKRAINEEIERVHQLNKPPAVLRASVQKLQAQYIRLGSQIPGHLAEMIRRYPKMQGRYSRPTTESDQFSLLSCTHQANSTCQECDSQHTVSRSARPNHEPHVHYSTIRSATTMIKDSEVQDELRTDMHVLYMEMEAAGLLDSFACLIIRGICDHGDSHNTKKWQPYAATVAAAYMKELLMVIPAQQVLKAASTEEIVVADYSSGHKYTGIAVGGQATAHFGDVHYHYSASSASKSPVISKACGLCLSSAPQMDPTFFRGRSAEMDAMSDILNPVDPSRTPLRLVLGGIGGVGKTQLAITYAQRHSGDYDSVFWLNASSEANLQTSFRYIAERALEQQHREQREEEQIVLQVSRWLSDTSNTRWLMIFDNYDEPDQFNIQKYYPHTIHGSIIVTTRRPDRVSGTCMRVQPLQHVDDGIEILETRSQRSNVKLDIHARRLAERLGGLPLALATAGAYLHKSPLSFERYLQEYEERWNVNPRRPLQLQEYSDRTLYTTWEVTYSRLEHDDPIAAQLLRLLAYFDHQNIWYELLRAGIIAPEKRGWERYTSGRLFRGKRIRKKYGSLSRWLVNLLSGAIEFENAMSILVEYGLVEVQTITHSYSMHSCVHDWITAGLNPIINEHSYWYAFDCVVASINKDDWELLGILKYARLTPHAVRLGYHRLLDNQACRNIPPSRLDQATYISELLAKQVQLSAAEGIYLRALAGKEKALGLEHTSTLNTVNNLGNVYRDQDKLNEAEHMYMRALTGYERALGPGHTSTLGTVSNLGMLYRKQGKPDEAERMFSRAVAGMEKVLGLEHIFTLRANINLGNVYRDQGKLNDAEQMYSRALAGSKKELGPEHTLTLDSQHCLANLYCERGELDMAEQIYLQLLNQYEKVLGPEHTSTFMMVNNLGYLYTNQGKLNEAEQMYMRALAGYEKSLGEHTSTLDTINNLGVLYISQGKLDEAEQMWLRALAGFEKALGSEHTLTLHTVKNLGLLYTNQGKLDEAERMNQRATKGQATVL